MLFRSYKSNVMSPSTIRGYTSLRKNHYSGFENLSVDDLTEDMVQKYVNKLAVTLSPKSVKNIYTLLCSAVKPYIRFSNIKLPQKIKTAIQIPTDEMVIKCLEASEGTELHTAILLAAYLGLRRSEICALTKDDINKRARTLSINKAVVLNTDMERIVKPPKSFAGNRTLTVPAFLFEELVKVKHDKLVDLDIVQITAQFERLTKKLGYSFRFHDLRHYNASVMLSLNIPNKYAQERMGHATDNMLKNVYQHTISKKQVDVSNTINTYFENVFSTSDNKKDNKNSDLP